ncbi:alternative ribosome rescue aminoacyl-tRNA hydrolase ArfB [Vicingaceae bacterium]|nr:alternative ribosome rescue aminoacyl-tRNA hydrolase ArfB [Vicingaceae bacterium]
MKYTNELDTEIAFKTSRSGGKGGQHVNKTETKVLLMFEIVSSKILKNSEKDRLLLKLKNRINQDGYLLLQNSKSRSQLTNKELVVVEFYHLINKALYIQKKRKSTKPTNASIKKRLDSKKRQAEKKKNRRSSY